MKLTESEYRRIYAMSYGGKSASYSAAMQADQQYRVLMDEAYSRPSPAVEPHKCRIERRKAKIKGEHVEVEWRH